MTFDLNIWHAGSYWLYLGQLQRWTSEVKVRGHMMKDVPFLAVDWCYYGCILSYAVFISFLMLVVGVALTESSLKAVIRNSLLVLGLVLCVFWTWWVSSAVDSLCGNPTPHSCLFQERKLNSCYVRFSFSVLSQEIGWEERLWNDLFCVRWGVKPSIIQLMGVVGHSSVHFNSLLSDIRSIHTFK